MMRFPCEARNWQFGVGGKRSSILHVAPSKPLIHYYNKPAIFAFSPFGFSKRPVLANWNRNWCMFRLMSIECQILYERDDFVRFEGGWILVLCHLTDNPFQVFLFNFYPLHCENAIHWASVTLVTRQAMLCYVYRSAPQAPTRYDWLAHNLCKHCPSQWRQKFLKWIHWRQAQRKDRLCFEWKSLRQRLESCL